MTYTLRPYQTAAVDAALAFLHDDASHRRRTRHGVIVAPTGSGKSLDIAAIATALTAPTVVFQPSREILEQNEEKLRAYGYRPAVFSASAGRKEVGDVTLATIGSVARQPERFRDVRYVLIDECHLVNAKGGMYREFFDTLAGARMIGLTATPYRLASNSLGSELRFLTRTRPRVFTDLVHYTQIGDLFRDGYLAPLQYVARAFDRSALRPNSTGADYSDASVRALFARTRFEEQLRAIVDALLAAGGKGILVFTRFIEESRRLVDAIGPRAALVTGETPKAERVDVLRRFRAGAVDVVANVGVLTLGFDYPELATVVLARPTLSLALYYQMVGRVLRPHPSKPHGLVVDLVGLVEQFGKVEDLTIRSGGKKGESWYYASGDRPLTNVVMDDPSRQWRQEGRVWHGR